MRRSSTAVAPLDIVDSGSDSGASGRAPEQGLRTEFSFILPRGYVDGAGTVHRDGVMRLATARDELVPLRDDRVRENPAYLTVVLLGRVVMTSPSGREDAAIASLGSILKNREPRFAALFREEQLKAAEFEYYILSNILKMKNYIGEI